MRNEGTPETITLLTDVYFQHFTSTKYDSPIVEIKVVLNASSENLNNTHVFPTPESPINNNLNK